MTRRAFLRDAALGGAGVVILSNSRSARTYAANTKLNVALIGVGGRGKWFVRTIPKMENVVALCDVNEKKATNAFKQFPNLPKYHDYRKMLDEMDKQIDAVVVATSDQSHAMASITAMKHGKHAFCEKGLTHTVYESRAMCRAAKKYKVATQMGNQGSSSPQFRRGVELIQDGDIGEVKEVFIFNAGGGSSYKERPKGAEKIPDYLKWDLWLGPTAHREFNPKWMRWSQWRDFGTGTIGMWGSHSGFLAWNAMKVRSLWEADPATKPRIKVSAKVSEINRISFPKWELVEFKIPARENLPPISFTWVNGNRQGEGRKRMEAHIGRRLHWGDTEKKVWENHAGALIVGTKGMVFPNGHNARIELLPTDKFAGVDINNPKRIPRARGGHEGDWFNACRDGKYTLADFRNSGPYMEFMFLSTIATQFDEELEYDPIEGKIVNNAKANEALHFRYREGWEELEQIAEEKPPAGQAAGRAEGPTKSPSPSGAAADAGREERAQGLLGVARGALRRGQRAAARSFLRKVIGDYPGTEAAKEAARLLKR